MSIQLEIRNLVVGYEGADVLHGISIQVLENKITCLLGANGAGKTTLIKSLLGLLDIRKGEVLFEGQNITGLPTHQIVRKGISSIPEGRRVFPKMTVEENLRVGAHGESKNSVIVERMEKVIKSFPQLESRLGQMAGTMSGGEQAMVSIGRGLMGAPKLLIIDEPSLGLSPRFIKENFKVIQDINNLGVSILLVEQNVHQTLEIAHRGYVLSQGRVIAEGESKELQDNVQVRAAYFGK